MRKRLWLPLVLLIALSACGDDGEESPGLVALPTRTPAPATETPEADELVGGSFEVRSLYAEVEAFLEEASQAGALERIDLISHHVLDAAPECFAITWMPDVQPLELVDFNLVALPLEVWASAALIYPDADLVNIATSALEDVTATLPMAHDFRVCLLPAPGYGLPEEQANGGVNGQVLAEDLLIISCSAGEYCLSHLRAETLRGYGYAYRIGQTGLPINETTLLGLMVNSGIADEIARAVASDVTFSWDEALTPQQETDLWSHLSENLGLTQESGVSALNVNRYLYGSQNQDRYPRFGGMAIGGKIVRAYRAAYPDVSLAGLAALPPETILADSGYAPASTGDSAVN